MPNPALGRWRDVAWWDVTGATLWAAWTLWLVLDDGFVLQGVVSLAAAVVYVFARSCGRAWGAVPGLVVAAVLVLVVLVGGFSGPEAGLLGYANATAALAVQGAVLAAIAVVSPRAVLRQAGMTLALLLAVAPWLIRAQAGETVTLLVVAAAAWLLVRRPRAPRPGPVPVAAAVLAVLGAVVAVPAWVGTRFGDVERASGTPGWLEELSQRRADLWHDAVAIASDHPWVGGGAESFTTLSPASALDPDTRQAHSWLLQTAAEQGWFGAGLLAALLAWLVVRVAATRHPVTLVALAGWTALLLQAGIDYVASFPAVTLTAVLALGLATGIGTGPVRTAPRPPAADPTARPQAAPRSDAAR